MLRKKVITVVLKNTLFRLVLLTLPVTLFLSACASSEVSRSYANRADRMANNATSLYDDATADGGDIGNAYQNTSQTTKGALLGASAGAVTGALSARLGAFSGAALGGFIGAGIGMYVDAHTTLSDRLINRGVNVIVLGDQVMLVLPSARLFKDGTSTIRPQAYSTLNLVAQYINRYQKTLVKISAYTNPLGPAEVDLALSRQQAHHIGNYLVETGMDARLVYAEGYGGTNLVAPPSHQWDDTDNYRIEITLEKLQA